jgi:hypothetical protein
MWIRIKIKATPIKFINRDILTAEYQEIREDPKIISLRVKGVLEIVSIGRVGSNK